MDRNVKKQWTTALRSGKYKQGKGKLRPIEGGFCCLGVLCDLHRKATGGRWNYNSEEDEWEYMGKSDYLPLAVAKWAGLDRKLRVSIGKTSLPAMNDGDDYDDVPGKSFAELASIIDKNL